MLELIDILEYKKRRTVSPKGKIVMNSTNLPIYLLNMLHCRLHEYEQFLLLSINSVDIIVTIIYFNEEC